MAALPDEAKRRTFRTILKHRDNQFTRETLAETLGLHPNGGRYNRDLAWLRTMGVIPERGGIFAMPGVYR